ncbi:DUF6167 family protein [Nocardioides sp. R-C-SC26]|uniref:DUF6167 family protein n=1 Tax=Nocardioides sp. R-C-SC26 TaxID=2870414 RepID=UPI001E51F6E2|nr:DUF6167 family protein [Nocardioides sp. R-C-SC26]
MSRAVWFVAGAGAGVYGMLRARRVAEALTVDGLRDRVGAAAVGARMFRDEVAQGKAEAEFHLRDRLAERATQLDGARRPAELTSESMQDVTQIQEGSTH